MITTNLVAMFDNKSKLPKAENSLRVAGFKPQDILVQSNDNSPLSVCVKVKDEYDLKMAENIFDFYRPIKVEQFNFEISSAEELRKVFSTHSGAALSGVPSLNHHEHYHEGMNSEVKT